MNRLKKALALIAAALMLASLVSCGEQAKTGEDTSIEETAADAGEKAEETEADETAEAQEEEEVTPPEEYEFDFAEEDNKVVWTLGPVTFVYFHDGVNVTGYETHIGYDTEEEAKLAYDALSASSEESRDEGIEGFSRDGNTIIVRYSAESSEIKTYEELIATSELFKNPESLLAEDAAE